MSELTDRIQMYRNEVEQESKAMDDCVYGSDSWKNSDREHDKAMQRLFAAQFELEGYQAEARIARREKAR